MTRRYLIVETFADPMGARITLQDPDSGRQFSVLLAFDVISALAYGTLAPGATLPVDEQTHAWVQQGMPMPHRLTVSLNGPDHRSEEVDVNARGGHDGRSDR